MKEDQIIVKEGPAAEDASTTLNGHEASVKEERSEKDQITVKDEPEDDVRNEIDTSSFLEQDLQIGTRSTGKEQRRGEDRASTSSTTSSHDNSDDQLGSFTDSASSAKPQ